MPNRPSACLAGMETEMLFDIHTHTTISRCSNLQIDTLLARAKELGLDGVCITDHQSKNASEWLQQADVGGLVVIVGMEYSSRDGDFLLFGTPADYKPHMAARDMLRLVDSDGGVAVAAHPCRISNSVSEYIFREGLCPAMEVLNGGNIDSENVAAQRWCSLMPKVATTGGSDAHAVGEVGRALTRFAVHVRNETELIAAIRTGRCSAEWGPAAAGNPAMSGRARFASWLRKLIMH